MRADHIELLGIGGASLIVWACTFMFAGTGDSVLTVSLFAASLSLVCNQPHFLGSYTLLYYDFRKNIFKDPRYIWAAVVAPGLLIAYLGYALSRQDADLMKYCVYAMFVLVGWHYVKQIFGCVIVGAVRAGHFYSKPERYAILFNLVTVWLLPLSIGPNWTTPNEFHGVTYLTYPGVPELTKGLAGAFFFSFALMVGMLFRKYIKEGVKPSAMGVVAMLAIYVWWLPSFHHPVFNYMVPFFHSLQYLVLAGQFKFNKEVKLLGDLEGEARRLRWFKRFILYWAVVLVLGAMFFQFIPNSLDAQGLFPGGTALGPTPFLAAFLLFINIHHYFIDNVIWRASNSEVREYLFNVRPRAVPATPAVRPA